MSNTEMTLEQIQARGLACNIMALRCTRGEVGELINRRFEQLYKRRIIKGTDRIMKEFIDDTPFQNALRDVDVVFEIQENRYLRKLSKMCKHETVRQLPESQFMVNECCYCGLRIRAPEPEDEVRKHPITLDSSVPELRVPAEPRRQPGFGIDRESSTPATGAGGWGSR